MPSSSGDDVGGDALWNYATSTRILRDPAEQHGRVVCPECGNDIEETKGDTDVRVPVGKVVDEELTAHVEEDSLPSHGWICRQHPHYSVICPARPESLQAAWEGVLVQFADGHARKVPIPRKEVRPDGE